ncbi:MAG: DUF819 family protein [Bacillota bacterium]
MTQNLVALTSFILFPAFIIWLSAKISLLKKLGLVLICYLSGIIVGNIGILPPDFTAYQLNIQDVSVAIALPLLLFSLDVKRWLKLSRSSLVSMLLAIVAITVTVFILQFTLLAGVDKGWQLGGMATALYTGGTPNVAAIKTALQVDNETYILFNTYDTVISLLYIFFMVSIARAFFQKIFRLKPYKPLGNQSEVEATDISDESVEVYGKLLKPAILKGLLKAFLLSAVILAVAFVVGELFPADSGTAITIFLITTLGIAASFIKAVRNIKYTFQLGMYIIYIFCFTVASMTKFDVLIHINWTIFLHVTFAIVGSMIIHGLLCKLFKIDADTMIITSVSAVCSPPFVPVVVSALKNRDILIGGLITGIIGYAIGNYLGIGVAMLFKILG